MKLSELTLADLVAIETHILNMSNGFKIPEDQVMFDKYLDIAKSVSTEITIRINQIDYNN